jgi:simple sugar transport system ATP-binding protein
VAGNGQRPLVEMICGLVRPPAGSVRLLGMEWRKFFADPSWDLALSYIPEDRQGLATCQGLDLLDNFLLTTRGGFVRGPAARRGERPGACSMTPISPPNLQALAWQLRGNLQKMVLAREITASPG